MGAGVMRNVAIRASAGSGKTYELAVQFIARLVQGIPPSSILATTFTRKAAAEILARTLDRVAGAAVSPYELTSLNKDLERVQRRLGISETRLDHDGCVQLLRMTCHELHRISVSTLDSLFARLLGAYVLETGIAQMPQLAETTEAPARRVRLMTLQQVLAQLSRDDAAAIVYALVSGRPVRSVVTELERTVQELYETFRLAPSDAWSQIPIASVPTDNELKALATSLRNLAADQDQKALREALEKTAMCVEEGNWSELLRVGPTSKVAEGSDSYARKPIPSSVRRVLADVVELAQAHLLEDLRRKTDGFHRLLTLFGDAYRTALLERNLMLFTDLPVVLTEALDRVPPDHVQERAELAPTHILLDEFQDTNRAQWEVLKRLLPRSGGSVFCAGDTKQAIYGWRGGCAAIFERLDKDIREIVWETRRTSYRSSQVILDFVDRVFSNLRPPQDTPTFASVIDDWRRVYERHHAHYGLEGYVEVRFCGETANADDLERDDDIIDEQEEARPLSFESSVAQYIAETANRYPRASIAVLTRSNRMAADLAMIVQSLGLSATQDGPGNLCDDPAVELVLSALHLADHPGSTAEAFHVRHSPLAEVLGLHRIAPASCQQASLLLRRRLAANGYGDTVAWLSQGLAPFGDARTAQRLTQLVEMAEEFDRNASIRPQDFVEYVRAKQVNEAFPARIRIMTIHQAKGLEFDIVVLPELHGRLMKHEPPVLTLQDDPTDSPRAVYAYANQETCKRLPELQKAREQYEARTFREALNLLYVAMTLARRALYLYFPARKHNANGHWRKLPLSLQSLVLDALDCPDAGSGVVFACGRRDWSDVRPTGGDTAPDGLQVAVPPPLAFDRMRPRRLWPQVAPTEYVEQSAAQIRDLLRIDREASDRGTVLHTWFQQIGWIEDGIPDEEVLLNQARTVVPDRTEAWYRQLASELRLLVSRPETRRVLSRPPATIELLRELPFAVRIGQKLVHGRMDRVLLLRDADGDRAVITDFKTDTVAPEFVMSRVELYRPQVTAYAEAASVMFRLSLSRITTQLLFVVPDVLVTVEPFR